MLASSLFAVLRAWALFELAPSAAAAELLAAGVMVGLNAGYWLALALWVWTSRRHPPG